MLRDALDWLCFSSLWVGLAAGLLCCAATLAMGSPPLFPAIAVASAGTIVVYNVDRLLDVQRDRETSPRRSNFISAHRNALVLISVAAALASAFFALRLGWRPERSIWCRCS